MSSVVDVTVITTVVIVIIILTILLTFFLKIKIYDGFLHLLKETETIRYIISNIDRLRNFVSSYIQATLHANFNVKYILSLGLSQ